MREKEREGECVCVSQVEKVIYTQALSPYTQRALITSSEGVSTPRSQVSLPEGLAWHILQQPQDRSLGEERPGWGEGERPGTTTSYTLNIHVVLFFNHILPSYKHYNIYPS